MFVLILQQFLEYLHIIINTNQIRKDKARSLHNERIYVPDSQSTFNNTSGNIPGVNLDSENVIIRRMLSGCRSMNSRRIGLLRRC